MSGLHRILRTRVPVPAFCAAILIAHAILHRVMADQNVVASMFAAGSHLSLGTLIGAVAFITLRLTAFLVVPPLLVWWILRTTLTRYTQPQ